MKKHLAFLPCLVLLVCLLSACSSSAKNDVRPGDTEVNRPGINDNVTNDKGVRDDNSIMGEVQQGVDNAGRALENGTDQTKEKMNRAVEDMTRNR